MRKSLLKYLPVRILISYKLTILCLALLFILTFWGTLFQVGHGLYQTKERIFNSWAFLAGGFFPFPGARLVLWISFLNLGGAAFFRLRYTLRGAGNLLVHFGMLILLAGSSFTLHFVEESHLTLLEGQGLNVSVDYHEWELAQWTEVRSGAEVSRQVKAVDAGKFRSGDVLQGFLPEAEIQVESFFPNCTAFKNAAAPEDNAILNASGIKRLAGKAPADDPARNAPGIILAVKNASGGSDLRLALYSGDTGPTILTSGTSQHFFSLRRKHYALPISIRLLDFKKEEHPGTAMAKSFSSRVEVIAPEWKREVVISMNKPLRYGDFTFYQSSYSQTREGETSTFSVVKNAGRLLPYIASLVISLGLFVHFIAVLVRFAGRRKKMEA